MVSLGFSMYSIVSLANSDCFTSFPVWITFISLSSLIAVLGLPKLCWIIVARVDILVLFLILEEILSVFHHWKLYFLCIFNIWPLLCWGRFPLCPLSGDFLSWVLNFVKSFFCIYWDDCIVFILQFVNMVYHIDWFAYIEESLHPWDNSHLIMVYDLFNVLLDSGCYYFVEDFCFYVHQWYWCVIFSFFVCVWYHCLVLVSGWWWPCKMSLGVFFCSFLEDFEKDRC